MLITKTLGRLSSSTISEKKFVKIGAHALSLVIVLTLVLQGFALPALVAAQTSASGSEQRKKIRKKKKRVSKAKKEDSITNRPIMILPALNATAPPQEAVPAPPVTQVTKDKPAVAPQLNEIKGVRREVTNLGVIRLQELGALEALKPKSQHPVEIKAIHPPQGIPEGARGGVVIAREDTWGKPRLKPREKSIMATIPSPAVTSTFKSDNLTFGFIPPDTMGAVGLTHVVTVTNEKYIIHDRTGATLLTVPLDALLGFAFNTFDPKILFDRFNNRFIVVVMVDPQTPTSGTAILWSDPGDPFTYNGVLIDVDATATAGGGEWADYPSIGFNKNWITVQINRFGFGSVSGYRGPDIYAIDKPTAYATNVGVVSMFRESFASCLAAPPAAQNVALGCGFTMVPAVSEDNLSNDTYITEDWFDTFGQLRLSRISGTSAAPVLTVGYQFPQSPYAWRFNSSLISGSGGYAPQRQQNIYLPSGTRITANDSRIQNAVFRNGSLWTTHHVMLARLQTPAGTAVGGSANPDIRSGVQWWEINPTLVDSATGTAPIQRAVIYDPRADNCHNGTGGTRAGCTTATQKGDFFTFPNISVNANNDVLIGYSRFSPFTLPKGAYSFRAVGDPPGTMRDSMVFREGQGNYNIGAGSPFNVRWGDFSAAMVDPLNDTDFWTIQEYALDQEELFGPGMFAGLWSTWWALIKPSTSAGTYSFSNSLLISEFRLRGPSGARDEFVEVYNPTDNPITVFTTDGSDGWTLVYSSPAGTITPLASIPNGTVIPAKGYYLITNEVRATGIAPYSMSTAPTGNPVRTADSDAMWTPDNADNGGLALFRTANQLNFIDAARMDSVGFVALGAGSIYREGAGLTNCAGSPTAGQQVSFKRKGAIGALQDTNDNAADFEYVSSTGASAQVCQPLSPGKPTPCNVDAIPANGTGCTGPP
jgi:hypothetical protein